jgi:hypothetical protein
MVSINPEPVRIAINDLRCDSLANLLQAKSMYDWSRRLLGIAYAGGVISTGLTSLLSYAGKEPLATSILAALPAALVSLERWLCLREKIVCLSLSIPRWTDLVQKTKELWRKCELGHEISDEEIQRLESELMAIGKLQNSVSDSKRRILKFQREAHDALGISAAGVQKSHNVTGSD